MDFYTKFFGQAYPLNKLDLVSVHKMPVRAMENWGCITFASHVLLTPVEDSTAELVQRNARTVAHEVSHMWFGNLVTMIWWDDIWLNEGFARYAEHHILAELRPEYQCWDKYNSKVFNVALDADRHYHMTHAVQLKCPSADNLMDIFDNISYAKGSVLCRMLASFTGDSWTTCLRVYFDRFKYKNATSKDLLQVCDETIGQKHKISATEFLCPWLTQPGYPELLITRTQVMNDELGCEVFNYRLKQNPNDPTSDNFIWPLLINIRQASGQTSQLLMTEQEMNF